MAALDGTGLVGAASDVAGVTGLVGAALDGAGVMGLVGAALDGAGEQDQLEQE